VKRRSGETGQVGLALSGGLDSRAILAAIPDSNRPIHAVTFGKIGSNDIKFAAIAAKIKGATRHVFEISGEGWLQSRFSKAWYTDGQLDLQHMHPVDTGKSMGDFFPLILVDWLATSSSAEAIFATKTFLKV
jgi:asparagine synthase (glutamine-hydrolysing)